MRRSLEKLKWESISQKLIFSIKPSPIDHNNWINDSCIVGYSLHIMLYILILLSLQLKTITNHVIVFMQVYLHISHSICIHVWINISKGNIMIMIQYSKWSFCWIIFQTDKNNAPNIQSITLIWRGYFTEIFSDTLAIIKSLK